MTGAGFGGSVVALVAEEDVAAFARHMNDVARAVYSCRAVSGARMVE